MSGLPTNPLPSTIKRNPHLWPAGSVQGELAAALAQAVSSKRKQAKPKMTKCELRFYEILKQRFPASIITPQFRLRVSPWGAPVFVYYTADFMVTSKRTDLVMRTPAWAHQLFEVKDSRRKGHSDELTRPKLCRENNPWISAVTLAVWNGSEWVERIIA